MTEDLPSKTHISFLKSVLSSPMIEPTPVFMRL
jgi:hypothetical protein